MNDLPNKIKIVKTTEIFSVGNILYLYYGGTPDAMYKIGNGAFHGLSAARVLLAIKSGYAVVV